MPHVVVIGAGLAGLTVALRRLSRGDRVTLLEASSRVGGQLHTETDGEFVIEHGAEGFVAGSAAVHALARDLGVEAEVMGQSVSVSCHYDGKQLIRLPPGAAGKMLGFQVSPRALGKGIESMTRGMGRLAEVLRDAVTSADVRLAAPVASVRRTGGLAVSLASGGVISADRVVIAAPAAPTARVLSDEIGEAAAALADSRALSSATVSLAFSRGDIDAPLDATGFVVAEDAQQEGFRACSFSSAKLRDRAPDSHALLRAFFRPTPDDLANLDESGWADRASRRIGTVLDVRAAPTRAWVSIWNAALPVFDDAHRQRVLTLESALAGSGISLAGAAFHGSGIEGAVRSAEAAARALDD